MIIFVVVIFLLIVLLQLFYTKNKVEKYDYKCFLLTLPESIKRREKFFKYHDSSIPIETIYGVNTKNIKNARKYEDLVEPDYFEKAVEMHYDNTIKRPDITYFNLGAIGCLMGHLEFYDRCFKQGLQYAVIFEDNVIVKSKRLYKEIQQIIEDKGNEFEMCFFHCISRLSDGQEGKLEKVKWISSTKCYLINVENMKKYVRYFLPMNNHVDMKHEDLISKGARIYYKDMRRYMKIDRTHNSTIGHSDHGRKLYVSRQNPTLTSKDVIWGY